MQPGEEIQNLIKDLGVDTVKKIGVHLTPKEISDFVQQLGTAKVKELVEKFGDDVMKHYGHAFFKAYKGVTQDTIDRLLKNEGIVKGAIEGCHDRATFLSELSGKGETLPNPTPMASNPDVVEYEYKLYQKDKAGNIIQPPTLSTGKPKLKTVIDGLASNSNKWKDIGNAAAEDAIKKKTFPAAGGEFSGVGNGTPIRGYYRGDKVDSFFPEVWRLWVN